MMRDKERLIRAFAAAIGNLAEYIPPDIGTTSWLGWIKDEIGRAVGLPREIGGIPLDEIGATGFGLVSAPMWRGSTSRCPWRCAGRDPGSLRSGRHAARFLAGRCCRRQRHAGHDRRREWPGFVRADRT